MIDKKIKNNAVSSYLFMAPFYLMPSKNRLIANNFVRGHSKTAFILQILLIIDYIIFMVFGFLSDFTVPFMNMNINVLVAEVLAILIIWGLVLWIKKAIDWETFSLLELKKVSEFKWNIENKELSEEEKLFQTLSYIPFLGLLISEKNQLHSFWGKISSIAGLVFVSLFAFGMTNSLDIFLLLYIIFLVFIGIYNFSKDSGVVIKSNIPNHRVLIVYLRTCIKYIFQIPFNKKFVDFNETLKSVLTNRKAEKEGKAVYAASQKTSKIPPYVCYIPFMWLFTIFNIKSSLRYHVINALILNATIVLVYFLPIQNSYLAFMLFPIFYWIANRNERFYKLPILGDLLDLPLMTMWLFGKKKEEIKDKYDKEETFSGKVRKDH